MTPKVKSFWISCSNAIGGLTYPVKCSLCGLFCPDNPCIQCLGEMEPQDQVVTYFTDNDLSFQGCLFRYPGRAGQAVRLLKYHRRTALACFMSDRICAAVEDQGIEYDLAVPIPIHWFRLAGRGFNQADLIASRLPNRSPALRRVRATRPQAGLSTSERLKNLDGAFEVIADVKGKTILLVDDVVTSGQTARECAKVLRLAGAGEVGILAFCGDS